MDKTSRKMEEPHRKGVTAMRLIAKAVLAIGLMVLVANYLAQDHPLTIAESKDYLMAQEPVQQFLNSNTLQAIEDFDLEDVMPSDFF